MTLEEALRRADAVSVLSRAESTHAAAVILAREVRRLVAENKRLMADLAQRLPRDVEDALLRAHNYLRVREVDQTDADDLKLLEEHGLMWSHELTDDERDGYFVTLVRGDTAYGWTREGMMEIRKIKAARAALEGK